MSAHVPADRLLLYAAGELRELDRRSIEEHLESCDACRAEADLLRRNTAFLRERLSSLTGLVQPDFTFLGAQTAPKPAAAAKAETHRERKRIPVLVPVAAVVLVLGAAGYLLVTSRGGENGAAEPAGDATTRVTRTATGREKPPGPGPEKPVEPAGPHPGTERPVETPGQPTPVRGGLTTTLPRLLTSPSQRQLTAVWRALAEKPEDASRILRSLEDPGSKEEKRVVLTLTLVGIRETREGRDALVAMLTSDGSPAVRRAAGAALGHAEKGDGASLPVARGLSVRLGPIEDEETRRALLAAAETERDEEVIGALVRLLAPSQGIEPSILPRLVELAQSGSETVRGHALTAIVDGIRSGPLEDSAPVLELVGREDLPVEARASILGALGPALGDGAAEALLGIYQSSHEVEIRVAAIRSLGDVPGETPEVLAELVTILKSGEATRIRAAALAAVSRRKDEASRDVLKEVATGDPDETIRATAKEALKSRGSR